MKSKKNIQSIYALSPLQEGILFEKLKDSEDSSYFIQNSFTLKGEINEGYIRESISLLSLKYDTLRTAIVIAKSTGKPWQVVLKNREIEIQKKSIKEEPISERANTLRAIKKEDIKRDFNLKKDSLLRITLIEMAKDEHVILWSSHHILLDGWCNSILTGDFFRFYELLSQGIAYDELKNKVLIEKEEVGSYGDFIKWLQGQDHRKALNYWRNLLSGYDTVAGLIPMKDEPINSEGNCVIHNMTLDRSKKVMEFAKKHNMTINRIVETAWGILLQKYNICHDVVFGKVVSGRNAMVKNIENAIGLFINTVPVRVQSTKDTKVLDLLKDMDRQAIESQEYDYYALSEIQKQSSMEGQLFDTLFVFENYYVSNLEMDLSMDFKIVEESGREETNYDICIGVDAKDTLTFDILYNVNKYSAYEIKLILERLDHLLLEMVDNPQKSIGSLSLIDEKEKEKVIKEFNPSSIKDNIYSEKTVVEHFEEQVAKTPENIALVYEEEKLTYSELNRKSNALAHKLRELGVGRNDIVAILTERCTEMMVAIYGTMKSGGAYGPIDPSFPKERIEFILEDYSPKVVLLGKGVDVPEGDYICLDLFSDDSYSDNEENPVKINKKEDLIYLTSTSGSTGKPKSVMVAHGGCTSYVLSFADKFNINEETIALQHTAYNFDTIVEEVYPAHIKGGKVVLYNEERIYDINKACDYMDKHEVTLISCSTLLLNEFNQSRLPKTVNLYLNGGDTLKYRYINNLLKHGNVGNTFGSTEETVCAALYHVPKDIKDKIPVGKPVVGRNVYICQGEEICGIGIPGELCVTGSGVSKGYLNREELTKEKFVMNPFGKGTMYRSGDLVRWLQDGNLDFLGRIDEQVKIRGYRVELKEIEEVLAEQEGIEESVVIAKEIGEDDKTLFAYVVMEEGEELDIFKLKEKLRQELPEYMVPMYIKNIDNIPLTVNGKIDKKALPAIEYEREDEYVAPRNSVEETLCSIFSKVLSIDKVGIKDNFFELGGDSIKAIRLTTLCKNQGYNISIKDLMKKGTVIELSQFLKDEIHKEEANREYGNIDRIPMNPLLKEFISNNLEDTRNLCHMILLESEEFDEVIVDALNNVVKIHPMLRIKYRNEELKVIDNTINNLPIYDLRRYEEGDRLKNQIINLCKRIQTSLMNMQGLLFKAALIRTRTKDYLFLCGHKLVTDSWSLKTVAQEIRKNYELLCKGKTNIDIKENTSYLNYIKTLEKTMNNKNVLSQLDYWSQISKRAAGSKLEPDKDDENSIFYGMEFSITEKETRVLLNLSESILGMDINEVLLGAFAIATKKLTGQRSISVTHIDRGRNRSEASEDFGGIGAYEFKYPIVLPTYGENEVEILCDIKRDLDYIPDNGIGYGWLSLNHKHLKEKLQPTVLFHGLDKTELEEESFKLNYSQNIKVEEILKSNYIYEKIAFYSFYKNNKLNFYIEFDESKFSKSMMNKLAKYYLKALIGVSKECMKYEKKNILLLDTGTENINNIHKEFINQVNCYGEKIVEEESIYKYKPSFSQQIFLDDTIGGGSSGRFEVEGEYTIEEVRKAILRIISEQSVLRTQYLKNENILIEYEPSIDHKIPTIDISENSKNKNQNQRENQIYAMVEKIGLDTKKLLEGPLLNKICIIKVSKNKYVVYVFIHHALWDMTSSSIFERRLNQLLKDPKLYQKEEDLHEYSQIAESITVEDKFKDIEFNEFVEAANNMELFYKNKSKMTVFKKKYNEGLVNSKVMTSQLSTMLKLLESIITEESTMKSVNKIPVIILHHGRNSKNRRALGLFQEPKLFVMDINDVNRHVRINEILANSPETCLGIKDLSKEQQNILNTIGRKIPSINAVTSYGDDSGITAERTLNSNIRKVIVSIIGSKVPVSVRCQFTDEGVIITATGFMNRERKILDAMDEIIMYGDIDNLMAEESMSS